MHPAPESDPPSQRSQERSAEPAPATGDSDQLISQALELLSHHRYALHPIDPVVQYHRAHAEIHGDEGSLVATNNMTQAPAGEVMLRNASGEAKLDIALENLYVNTISAFKAAIAGEGHPLSTGEDGVASLAVGLAALQSAKTGRAVDIASL